VTEWVTAAEAAKMAGVSRQYMHNCTPKFKSASRLSDVLVFKRTEVERWIRQRESEMEPPIQEEVPEPIGA